MGCRSTVFYWRTITIAELLFPLNNKLETFLLLNQFTPANYTNNINTDQPAKLLSSTLTFLSWDGSDFRSWLRIPACSSLRRLCSLGSNVLFHFSSLIRRGAKICSEKNTRFDRNKLFLENNLVVYESLCWVLLKFHKSNTSCSSLAN